MDMAAVLEGPRHPPPDENRERFVRMDSHLRRRWAVLSVDRPCGPGSLLPKGPKDARYVENIVEHVFLSELLQYCWFFRSHPVEVSRPDVDAGGYDLVLEA